MSNVDPGMKRDQTLTVSRAIYDAYRRQGRVLSFAHLEAQLYLSHGWSLAITGDGLLTERFVVEGRGPMLYSLVNLRRRYRDGVLPDGEGDRIFGGRCIPYGDDVRKIEVIQRCTARYGGYADGYVWDITRMRAGAHERALLAGQSFLSDSEIRTDFVALAKAGRKTSIPTGTAA